MLTPEEKLKVRDLALNAWGGLIALLISKRLLDLGDETGAVEPLWCAVAMTFVLVLFILNLRSGIQRL
jgi:hypothetical protein